MLRYIGDLMKSSSGNIGLLQNTMIILLCIGLMNHVLVIPQILEKGGRDAWISIIFAGVPLLIWIPILYYTMKKIGHQHIVLWIKENYSPWLAWILITPFLIYLFLMGFITIRDTSTWLVTSNLPQTPMMVTASAFMFLCFLAAKSGIRAIAISSGILLPLVLVFGYFAAITNMKFKDYGLLRPFFENGIIPSLKGMIYSGAGMVELIIIVLLQRHLKSNYKLWHLLVIGVIIIYFLLGPVTAAIAEFGPFVAAIMRYPAFEEWRLVKIGRHLEHVDFLVIYQWTSGAFIRIATVLFLIVDLLNIKQERGRTLTLFLVSLMMLGLNQIPLSDPTFLFLLTKYYFPISLIVMLLCSFALFALAFFSKRQGRTRA